MKLYHCVGARSLRALWTLKELGSVKYELVTMPFPPRVACKEYLKVNMLGTIPYFVDGDAKMTESSGIPFYLTQKYDPKYNISISPDDKEYGAFLNWLFHSDATLTFPQTIVLRYEEFEPHKNLQEAASDYKKWYLARLRLLDSTLQDGREFLCGNRFTIADVCVGYALWLGQRLDLQKQYKHQTLSYLQRITNRPAFLAALEEEAESLSSFSTSKLIDEKSNL